MVAFGTKKDESRATEITSNAQLIAVTDHPDEHLRSAIRVSYVMTAASIQPISDSTLRDFLKTNGDDVRCCEKTECLTRPDQNSSCESRKVRYLINEEAEILWQKPNLFTVPKAIEQLPF